MLGQVIARREKDSTSGADPYEIWHRFSGRQMGYVGNNGDYDVDYASSVGQRQNGPTNSFADFDLATDHINSYTQGSRGGMYTVHGDTSLRLLRLVTLHRRAARGPAPPAPLR